MSLPLLSSRTSASGARAESRTCHRSSAAISHRQHTALAAAAATLAARWLALERVSPARPLARVGEARARRPSGGARSRGAAPRRGAAARARARLLLLLCSLRPALLCLSARWPSSALDDEARAAAPGAERRLRRRVRRGSLDGARAHAAAASSAAAGSAAAPRQARQAGEAAGRSLLPLAKARAAAAAAAAAAAGGARRRRSSAALAAGRGRAGRGGARAGCWARRR
jgi:hypothetical protein